MNIEDIILILDVNKYKSFGEAAEENAISESSLSKRVKKAEIELGDIKLFNRSTRSVSLTREGEVFVAQGESIVTLYTDMLQELRMMHKKSSHTIRIGVIPSLGRRGVSKSLISFYEEFPELYFQIHEGRTSELLKLLRAGDIDIAFIIDGNYSTDAHRYVAQKQFVTKDNLVLIANGTHKLAKKKSISLRDIESENLILLTSASQTRMIIDDAFNNHDISPKYVQECAQVDMIFDLVDANFGVSVLGEKIFQYSYEGDQAVMLPIEDNINRDMVMLVSSSSTTAPRYLKAFTKHIIADIADKVLE